MSFANWNPTAFYNAGDIVIEGSTTYQAVVVNYDKQPSLNTPAIWFAFAPAPPSNQLAFNQPTTNLSIVGGNTVDISPQLAYQTGDLVSSLPTQTVLNVGNSSVNIPFISRYQYVDPSLVAPVYPNTPIYLEFDPPAPFNPPSPYRWLEAHWYKQDPNPLLNQDKYGYIENGDGFIRIGSEWDGVGPQSIFLKAENVFLENGVGPNSGLFFQNGALNGNLYQDAAGDLYWNGTKLN